MRHHTSKYADFFVKININKNIESLNISNSAAIVFHHLSCLKKILISVEIIYTSCICPCSSVGRAIDL